MRLRSIALTFTMIVGAALRTGRAEPHVDKAKFDFAIIDTSCQMLVSALVEVPGRDAVSVSKGETITQMCWRKNSAVHCEYSTDDGKTTKTSDYQVRIETVALIEMANDVASEVTYVDPRNHVSISTTRSFMTTNRGGTTVPLIFVKSCKGNYLTYDEVQLLGSKK